MGLLVKQVSLLALGPSALTTGVSLAGTPANEEKASHQPTRNLNQSQLQSVRLHQIHPSLVRPSSGK